MPWWGWLLTGIGSTVIVFWIAAMWFGYKMWQNW
jgi:hypothetical protein